MRIIVTLAFWLIALPAGAQTTVTWDALPGATGYAVCYGPRPDSPDHCADTTDTTWTHASGIPGVTYHYWLMARNETGFGPFCADPGLVCPPIVRVYAGSTTPPPPPPPGGGGTPLPPPIDAVPSPVPTLMPPATQFVDAGKNVWALVFNEWGGSVHRNGAYLTHADQVNLRDVGVTMRQGARWFLWNASLAEWAASGDTEPAAPAVELCGDGIDNDGDGLIDEPDAGCLPPPPPPPDPCVDVPLRITNLSWPSAAAGSRQFRYTSSQPIARVLVVPGTATLRSAVFADTRGCTVTVK